MAGNRKIGRVSRDSVLFVLGLLGIANETIFQHGERPTLLILFAAMAGLPAFLHTDEKVNPPPPALPPAPPPVTLPAPSAAPVVSDPPPARLPENTVESP